MNGVKLHDDPPHPRPMRHRRRLRGVGSRSGCRRAFGSAFAGLAVIIAGVCVTPAPVLAEAGANEILRAEEIVRQVMPRQRNRTRGIMVEPEPAPSDFRRVALPAIQFEFDSDRLTRSAVRQLAELAAALQSDSLQGLSFAVEGHTDSVGAEAYNRALSLRRARAVKSHLVYEKGVLGSRLIDVGLGESFPIAGLSSENERNRRVEIVNLGGGGGAQAGHPSEKRALLIGVDNYQHVSALDGPRNDAIMMASFLDANLGYADRDIKTLLNSEATRDHILAAIEDWLIAGTSLGDEVFLFFSGHGFQQPDMNGDEADRLDETLVPVDVRVEGDGEIKGMITDDEVAELLNRLSGRQVHVVIDACHSGTGTRSIGDWRYVKSPRLPDGTPLRVASVRTRGVGPSESFLSSSDGPGLTVWSAVRADQKALIDEESEDSPGSVFTRRLLWGARDGRADRDEDGIVTVGELHEYILEESRAYCERHFDVCGRGLTPQIHTNSGRIEEPAFGRIGNVDSSSPRVAALAKDILVHSSVRPATTDIEGSVRLRMNPGPEVEIGTELDIVLESDHDGWFVLMDINAAGQLVQIYPNESSIRSGVPGQVRTGHPVMLPGERAGFRFRAVPPLGRGVLIAVVAEENGHMRKLASRHKDLSIVPRPEAYIVELGEALRSGDSQWGDGSGLGWAVGTLEYEIVSR